MSYDFRLIDSDIKIKQDGSVDLVSGVDKLKQDIIKIILTPIGSMRLHPWYGSFIDEGIVGNTPSDDVLEERIKQSISEGMEKLKKLQIAQAGSQRVSNDELINTLERVIVQRAYYDKRIVNVIVSVITRSLSKIEESFQIN